MNKYFKLGSYSISILHYSLYHWNPREVVFLRPIRVYENWLAHYYGYKEDEKRMYNVWWNRIEKDPKYIFKFGQNHQKNFKNLNKFLDRYLKKIPNSNKDEMLIIFKKYWNLLFLSQPIGDINHTIDEIYLKRITGPLKKVVERHNFINKFTEYLIDLTTPLEMLPTQKEELSFLQKVLKIKNNKVKNSSEILKRHLKEYEWIPVWYDNQPWDIKQLQIRLNEELKTTNIRSRVQKTKDFPKKICQSAQKITKQLELKGRLLQDIEALRYFTYIRTEIDLHTGFIIHKARPIYERIAELLDISFNELKFLTPEEIHASLRKKLDTNKLLKIIKPRQKFAVQIFNRSKQKIIIGKKAKIIAKDIRKEFEKYKSKNKNEQKSSELQGIGASVGSGNIVNGRARVISSISQLDSMKKGEILVVPSTSVDFVSAMKQSIAVVTELGGLTCHAAIVSRELGKPCIVNTLKATKVFKNGDMIEVDAVRGIVKKI